MGGLFIIQKSHSVSRNHIHRDPAHIPGGLMAAARGLLQSIKGALQRASDSAQEVLEVLQPGPLQVGPCGAPFFGWCTGRALPPPPLPVAVS
jgi:hypothetical protein